MGDKNIPVGSLGGCGGGKLSNGYSSLGHAISDYWASSNQYVNFSGGYARLFNAPSFPSADVDEDGMPDAWERIYQFDVTENNASEDSDEDGLTNIQEYALGLNPLIADTDEDGLLDGVEVNDHKTNPLLKDSDADGFEDAEEIESGTSPNNQEVYPVMTSIRGNTG